MYDTLAEIHRFAGYVVFAVVLIAGFVALSRRRSGREFSATPWAVTVGLLDAQVLLGLVMYGVGSAWEFDEILAYVHPAVNLLGVAVAHYAVRRARGMVMVDDAHTSVGRGLLTAAVIVALGIGLATSVT